MRNRVRSKNFIYYIIDGSMVHQRGLCCDEPSSSHGCRGRCALGMLRVASHDGCSFLDWRLVGVDAGLSDLRLIVVASCKGVCDVYSVVGGEQNVCVDGALFFRWRYAWDRTIWSCLVSGLLVAQCAGCCTFLFGRHWKTEWSLPQKGFLRCGCEGLWRLEQSWW